MFEAINVFTPSKEIHIALPDDNVISSVTVPKGVFTSDLASASRTSCVRKQVSIDASRCHLEVDGVRCLDIPETLPESLLPLCTQAIMGLPVDLLQRSFDCVVETEKRSPLKVCLTSSGDIVAHKQMRIFNGNQTFPVDVSVIITESDSHVSIILTAST